MMTAKVRTAIVSIECPKCGMFLENPTSGSTDWDGSEVNKLGGVAACDYCGVTFRIAKTIALA